MIDRPGRRPGQRPGNVSPRYSYRVSQQGVSYSEHATRDSIFTVSCNHTSRDKKFNLSCLEITIANQIFRRFSRYNQVVCNARFLNSNCFGLDRPENTSSWLVCLTSPPCNQSTPMKHVLLPRTIVGFILSAQEVLRPPTSRERYSDISLPAFHVCLLACLPVSTSLPQCLGLLQHELHSGFLH